MSLPESPPPLPPPPLRSNNGCAIAALIVLGLVLLLPGLCVIIIAASDGKIDARVPLFILGGVIVIVLVAYEIRRRRLSR